MRVGFLATLLAWLGFAGLVHAQPLALGNLVSNPEPSPPSNYVDIGRPRPLKEPAKPAGQLSVCSHTQTVTDTESKSCSWLPACCKELCMPEKTVCGPEGRVWASAEYLLWWFEGNHLPPLVTTSPAASAGVLGAPGTTVLFGDRSVDDEAHSGGRFTLGFWLNECQTIGVEAGYLFLGSHSTEFTAGGSGLPGSQVIARPIVNGITGAETAELVSFPGAAAGNVHVLSSSRLEGTGISAVANICCDCCYRVDVLAGFQYLELREGLGASEFIALSPSVPTIGGSTLAVADQFDTRNQFYGGQLGARAEYRWGRIFVNSTGSVALGSNHEIIDIHGSTIITPAGGARTTVPGGILALPTNSGQFSRDRFAVVPQLGLNVGYQVTPHVRAFVGYGVLYVNNVVRPAGLIDRTVNLTQVPSNQGPGTLLGPARPALVLRDTEFWAQGVNFGVEVRY